tara:strand:+ start:24499 stop:24639 length:141 start_codon:yes stop_codon:yes gene_type:complete
MAILAHVCRGEKGGRYHVTYGTTWHQAVERWYATEPKNEVDLEMFF